MDAAASFVHEIEHAKGKNELKARMVDISFYLQLGAEGIPYLEKHYEKSGAIKKLPSGEYKIDEKRLKEYVEQEFDPSSPTTPYEYQYKYSFGKYREIKPPEIRDK